jgi:branched-chain amino acid transport system substrate-binding protein
MDNPSTEIKIGVLLPKSSLYPGIGLDIRDGLKAALSDNGNCHYRLVLESIGNGGSDAVNYDKAEKLLLQEEVTAVVAYLDYNTAIKLGGLFQECKRPLIVLDPGANPPLSGVEYNPYVFVLSLQGALNSYLTGKLAGNNGARRTFFSTSFYEGGYLHCSSYQSGLMEAGGQVLYHAIIPLKTSDFKKEEMQHKILELQPDSVLAQFSSESGAFFLEQYKESGLQNSSRLYLSSFMLEEGWINNITYPFDGMTGIVTWFRNLETEENHLFKETMFNVCDKEATIFSLLGWEAGLLMTELMMQHNKAGNKSFSKTVTDFKPQQLRSPRGILNKDVASNIFFGPAYLVEVVPQEATGNCVLKMLEEIPYDLNGFTKEIPEGSYSKWNNTYLCI